MATTMVGLDIGSFAVRAAELSFDSRGVSLRRFAQVALPRGAVIGGEVTDSGAVVTAIRRLWSEGQFSTRRVVIGLSSQRVIVRQADVASMSDDDLRSAIRYEAQDLIPIPVDQTYLDCQVVDRPAPKADDEIAAPMKILLAAAQKPVVEDPLAVLASAGLEPVAIDVVAFAMTRAVPPLPPPPEGKKSIEAIVCVGADLTVVTVREGVQTKFVRVLPVGGAKLTQAMIEGLGVDPDRAEHYKRQAAGGDVLPGPASQQTATVLMDEVDPLVDEICGSLNFYRAQARIGSIDRIVVTGGSIQLDGLVQRLAELTGIDVLVLDPISWIRSDCDTLTQDQLEQGKPYMGVAVGLAMWGAPGLERQISLLPPEAGEARRRRKAIMSGVVAIAAVAAVLSLAFGIREQSLRSRTQQAVAAQGQVAALRTQVARLGSAVGLKSAVKTEAGELEAAALGDVDWVRLIGQIAAVMPPNVLITSLSTTGPVQSSGSSAAQPGTLTVSAVSSDGRPSIAAWIEDLQGLPSLSTVWVPSLAAGDGSTIPTQSTTFQSSANITDKAASDRAEQIIGGTP